MKYAVFLLILAIGTLALPARAQMLGGGDPHGGASAAPVDRVEPASELPRGTLEVILLDANEQPVPNHDVTLGIQYTKIAEGESRSSKSGRTGPDGKLRFDGLDSTTSYSYRVSAKLPPAEYSSHPFNLRDTSGMRVTLHVYPATSDVMKAVVGLRGFFYIETRDDVFQIEVLFRVINLGKVAWVPSGVEMGLPTGFKAFSGGDAMADGRFEAVEGRGAKLTGTFPPGQRDLSFRFQIPKDSSSTQSFRVQPPPRTVEMRVIAVASANMGFNVDGFETPRDGVGPSGDRVLVTRKLVSRETPEVGAFVVTLSGLPVPGPGRWIAAGIALVFGLAGAAAALGKLRVVTTERAESDRARARELLLSELVSLETAKAREQIGPSAYERTRLLLADALSRIGLPGDGTRERRALRAKRA